MDLSYIFNNGDVVKRVWITPDMARFWLETYKYKYQRNIAQNNVNTLTLEMLAGRFNEQTTISFAMIDGKYVLLDGQHRLAAIVKSNKPTYSIVSISEKKTEQEVALAYASFDRQRTRGLSDALHIYEIPDVTKTQSQHVGSGLKYIYSGFDYNIRSNFITPMVIAKMLLDWSPYVKKFYNCIDHCPNSPILKKGIVVGFALVTFRYAEDIAKDFWYQIAFDDGLSLEDPRKTCIRYLYSNKIGGLKQPIHPHELAVGINKCWGAYVEGRNLSKVYAKRKDNLIIARTPYDSTLENFGIDYEKYVNMMAV